MIEVAGETAQPVRELAAVSEESTWNGDTHKVTNNPLYVQVQRPLLVSVFARHTRTQSKHPYTYKVKNANIIKIN